MSNPVPPFSPWSRNALTVIAFLTFVASAVLSASYFLPELFSELPFELPLKDPLIIASVFLLLTLVSLVGLHKQRTSKDGRVEAYHALAKELSQVANKSEIVINAIGDGVIALDSQGVIQLINPAAQTILGWDKQDAEQLDYRSVLKLFNEQGEALPEDAGPIQQVLKGEESIMNNDLMLETRSGKRMNASVLVSPIGNYGNGAIVVFRDITNVVSENRQRTEFISTASHEMRTPVAAIEGYIGLALNPATAQIDGNAREYLSKAHESAQHLGRLFQDLLDVSKAEDGRLKTIPKVIEIVSLLRDSTAMLMPSAHDHNLSLIFKPDVSEDSANSIAPIFYTEVDPDHLKEVVANLIENAIKYTKEGSITVNITGDDNYVTFSVTDTGIGIAKEDIPHLFQKFYRIDNTETREIGGTGLGLYLCRRLVESMDGRLWIESDVGKGSTFFVELKRMSAEEAERKKEEAEASVEQN